jgi:cyclomaltodextrinase
MWASNSVFYQIYPLGLCGAPKENDGVTVNRIKKVADWTCHINRLGADAVYFSPVFSSDRHGYDTRDYRLIDCRLGTNEDFKKVCSALHASGIRVVLDGVFNHVGRGFWAFQDVLKNREASPYRDWFFVDFGRDNGYGDGLFYEGWEGHYELVKLNVRNPQVEAHLFSCIRGWVQEFDIDGLRLDVAYCIDKEFLKHLRTFCDGLKPDFALIGEVLFGDYNQLVNDDLLHSCTNYECYKGLHSSFNSMNLFEISHSLARQFGPEGWTLYKGKHLLSFVDNHDVSRIASILSDKEHLPLLYVMLFCMPGIPCVYYGSEWGCEGRKEDGDDALRPCFDSPEWNALTDLIAQLAEIHKQERALQYGGYQSEILSNRQLVFRREYEGECVLVAINADSAPFEVRLGIASARSLLCEKEVCLSDGVTLPGYGYDVWKIE